jgi:hypothetical protein
LIKLDDEYQVMTKKISDPEKVRLRNISVNVLEIIQSVI